MLYVERYSPNMQNNFAANGVGLATIDPVDMTASSTVALPAGTTINGSSVAALGFVTSTSANALGAGRNGTTNPQFNVDCSTSSAATGFNVKGAAAGAGIALSAISSGTDENLTLNAKGAGTITLNGTATGVTHIGHGLTVDTGDITVTANASKLTFTGTGSNGGVLKNLKNAAASALSGTQLDIAIDIGGVPYYFTVYPTKA